MPENFFEFSLPAYDKHPQVEDHDLRNRSNCRTSLPALISGPAYLNGLRGRQRILQCCQHGNGHCFEPGNESKLLRDNAGNPATVISFGNDGTACLSGLRIRAFRKLRNGLQAAPVIAIADKERAAAHIIDRVLFEPDSDLAGLLEIQRSGITRFGVPGDWRVSGDRSNKLPSALQFGAKSLARCSVVL